MKFKEQFLIVYGNIQVKNEEEIRNKTGGTEGQLSLSQSLKAGKGVCTPVCGPQPGQELEVGVTGC